MRVTLVTRGVGGALANVASGLARGLHAVGADVHVVAAAGKSEVDAIRFPPRAAFTWLGRRSPYGAVAPLVRHLTRDRPHVAIALGRSQNLTALAAQVASRWRGGLVLSEHGLKGVEGSRARSARRDWLTPRLLYRRADAIGVVSQEIATSLRKHACLPETMPVEVIPNPVDREALMEKARAATRHPWIADRSRPLVLNVGRLVTNKDHALLIEAFSLLRRSHDARLLIIGEGPMRGALQRQIDRLGLEGYVELPGRTSNPLRYMARADAFVSSSRIEGASLVTLEAMAVGCPVVATRSTGGLPRVVGDAALLVPPSDPRALADGIARVLDDDMVRTGLISSGVRRVDEFAPEKVALSWLDLADRARPFPNAPDNP